MSTRRTVTGLVCVLVLFSYLYSLGVSPLRPRLRPEPERQVWPDLEKLNVTVEVCGVACNASRWWNGRVAAPRDELINFTIKSLPRRRRVSKKEQKEWVHGWPPDANRNMFNLVRPNDKTVIIRPRPSPSSSPLKVLVVVHSAPKNFKVRSSIRETWASLRPDGVQVVFIVGTTIDDRGKMDMAIRKEADKHGDILQEDFVDHYNNLTIKSVFMLKYFLSLDCQAPPAYLFKADDDSYVLLNSTITYINSRAEDKKHHEIAGILFKKSAPIRSVSNKWYAPEYMFDGTLYPAYISGSGYIMDVYAAECVYCASLNLPFFHMEDVFITGFAAQSCSKVKLTENGKFRNFRLLKKGKKFTSEHMLLHYVEDMRAVHNNITKGMPVFKAK